MLQMVHKLSTRVQTLSTQNQNLSTQNQNLGTRLQALEAAQAPPNLEGEFLQVYNNGPHRRRGEGGLTRCRRSLLPVVCPMTKEQFDMCGQL